MRKLFSTTLLLILLTNFILAQDGKYDVRFNINSIDCNQSKFFVDLEIKASSNTNTFNLAEQNFRFSFNRSQLANPAIHQELTISGFVSHAGTNSLYPTHSLVGSRDTVVSYNVELSGGDGYPIGTDWVSVGRLSFDILNSSSCINLKWHTHSPQDFPPTFIGEKWGGSLFGVIEGNYVIEPICLDTICPSILPIELTYFKGTKIDCEAHLAWQTITEINNHYFELQSSEDGTHFETREIIKGAGNTTKKINYATSIPLDKPKTYFRLKQVDFDGSFDYTSVVSLESNCIGNQEINSNKILIYPNPFKEQAVSFAFEAKQNLDNALLNITDINGRVVFSVSRPIQSGLNQIQLNLQILQAGTYFFHVSDAKSWQIHSAQFIKL